jgi:hypothetical protein
MTRGVLVAALWLVLVGCGGGAEADPDDFLEVPGIGETRVDVPRPTGAASAACDGGPMPPASDETISERVAALRAVGLFADRADTTDEDLVAEVEAGIVDVWGDAIGPDHRMADLFVADQDQQRVWWRDLEADVIDGNDVYVVTLKEWAAISQGAFAPDGIEEAWASDEGPVTLTFTLGGEPHEIAAAYLEDWIDPGVLVSINELIASSGRRFELYKAFDQTAFVMALTDAERGALEARGWCFE